jgi:ABC-type dipeptide/oligopeptide/nickel transport system ATPase component
MPKVRRVTKIRTKASSILSNSVDRENNKNCLVENEKGPEVKQDLLSRGQRKRLAKREQYLKREQMIMSSLKLSHEESQKNRLDGLDAIKNALAETIRHTVQHSSRNTGSPLDKQSSVTKSNFSKKKIAHKEINQLNLVLQHPSYISNPFATIQEHLKNSFATQAEQQEKTAAIQREENAKRVEEKKEERKERIRNSKFEKSRKQRRR